MLVCISLYYGTLIKLINLVVFVLYLKAKTIYSVLESELSEQNTDTLALQPPLSVSGAAVPGSP